MLPWKLRKRQILPINQNLLSVYFSLAKFQLVSCNVSLAMIWQMTYTHKLPKLCSATLMWGIGPFWDAVRAVNIKQATRWVSDKAYNILGPVNSCLVYALSTDISVRESTFDFLFSLFTLKIDFEDWLLIFDGPCLLQ